jgi:predicted DNA-binding protein
MKKKIAITIDEDLYRLLEILSVKEGRAMSNQINKIIKEYFESKKSK